MKKEQIIFTFFIFALTELLFSETHNIVLLETMNVPVVNIHSRAIQDQLQVLSDKTGMIFDLEVLKGGGNRDHCSEILKTYLESKDPDIVLTIATLATQVAVEALKSTDLPILFSVVMDPVGSDIVEEVGVPSGTNVSGVVYTHQRDTKVEMVMRILNNSYRNKSIRFGFISTDYPSSIGDLQLLNEVAEVYGNIEFVSYIFPYEPIPDRLSEVLINFQKGIDEIKDDIDFFWEAGGPLGEVERAIQLLKDSGVPVIHGNRPRSVEMGALVSIATNYQETGLQIGEMVEKILNGTEVGSIPVATPRRFDLHLNKKTAEELGLKIPSHILMIAGDNIYQ